MQFVMSHLHHFKMQGAFAVSMGLYSSKKQIPTHYIKFILTGKCGAIHIGISRTKRQHVRGKGDSKFPVDFGFICNKARAKAAVLSAAITTHSYISSCDSPYLQNGACFRLEQKGF
jgi:hypothetical protein